MTEFHKTLLRQLKKSNLDSMDKVDDFKIFLKMISNAYHDYDQQIERINNTLDVSLKKSFLLTKTIEKNAKNDFKLLIEGLPGLVAWFDRDLNYLGVNENFIKFTNRAREDFFGKKLGEIDGDSSSKLNDDFKLFINSNMINAQSDYMIQINHNEHFVNSHFQKIDNGKIIIIASIDQTERVKMQNIINEQNEAALNNSKLAALGELAAGVAHEINNPLTVILSCSKILMKKINNSIEKSETLDDFKDTQEKLDKIFRMSNRVAKIVKNLKHISRDGSEAPYSNATIEEVLSCAIELNSEKMKSSQIDFSIEGNLQLNISCQPVSLSQVFMNLIGNSIDAISGMENAWIKYSIDTDENNVIIKIMDCGNGIPQIIQDKIFQPFFTTKAVGIGTGLGLSISKDIIESHNGQFYIDNQCPNTCFIIKLPKVENDGQNLPPK